MKSLKEISRVLRSGSSLITTSHVLLAIDEAVLEARMAKEQEEIAAMLYAAGLRRFNKIIEHQPHHE